MPVLQENRPFIWLIVNLRSGFPLVGKGNYSYFMCRSQKV